MMYPNIKFKFCWRLRHQDRFLANRVTPSHCSVPVAHCTEVCAGGRSKFKIPSTLWASRRLGGGRQTSQCTTMYENKLQWLKRFKHIELSSYSFIHSLHNDFTCLEMFCSDSDIPFHVFLSNVQYITLKWATATSGFILENSTFIIFLPFIIFFIKSFVLWMKQCHMNRWITE